MCGITGIVSTHSSAVTRDRLKTMTDQLAHRGPDGEAYWISESGQVGLGHRRLAIIDLSPEAGQPMTFHSRYTIVYNGEIYNFPELREFLIQKGYRFVTRSDTEVILASFDHYREQCLQHFDGMFALAIWDQEKQLLFMARDRFGEKPFYYSLTENQFLFASEKKALWAGGIEKKINLPLLLNFLTTGHTQTAADNSINYHQEIFSLPPAHYAVLRLADFSMEWKSYWDLDKESQITLSEKAAEEKWKELLLLSVKSRLRSDVPLGTCLSGGLDSSSVLALIRKLQVEYPDEVPSGGPNGAMKTFSAIFPGFKKDESEAISRVVKHLGLQSSTLAPTADELIRDFEKLCAHQEEPFSSASTYAQFKVFELAGQKQVKVLLDGQGADETLAGYGKYIPWYLQELLRAKPWKQQRELRAFRKNNIPFKWGWKNYLAALFPAQAAYQLEKREARRIQTQPDIRSDFRQLNFDRPSIYKPLVLKLNDILYFDCCRLGLEELLRFADRNSMAHGLETRHPFLSHELVQFLFSLPSHFKMRDGWTKWMLRMSMSGALPGETVWRKDKIGFEPPQKIWMENDQMKDYIQEARRKLVRHGILKPGVLNKIIQPHDAHAAEGLDWRYLVTAAFM
jgi:asparagine synthase (glutamine-hydrolysing)